MATKVGDSPWLKDGDEKRQSVQAMFAEIAPTYDLMNSLMSLRLHHRWRRFAANTLGLKKGQSALDVCCGTGDFLTVLRDKVGPEGKLIGVDFCAPMLQVAAEKKSLAPNLVCADACHLPLSHSQFDAATVGWGLRNVPSLSEALSEIHRVLKPGGRFVSLDMARPKGVMGKVSEIVFHTLVPALGTLFGKRKAYQYLPKSTLRFVSPEELEKALTDLGFVEVGHRYLYFGNVAMVWGKKV